MSIMASQITSLAIVFSSIYSGADQRKHQSSVSLAFVRVIHQWPVNSPHKAPVPRKMFPFDDVIMMVYMQRSFCVCTQPMRDGITLQCSRSRSWMRQISKLQSGNGFLWTHIPPFPIKSAILFMGYIFFKTWSWKSKAIVIAQGLTVDPTSQQLTSLSFQVNQPSHSRYTTCSKFDFENLRSRSWVGSKFKVTKWVWLIDSYPFVPCQSTMLFMGYDFFKTWPWKSKVKVKA